MFLLLLVLVFGISACGVSPILNHDKADELHAEQLAPANVECPLDFNALQLCAKLEWQTGPNGAGENSFVLKFWDKKLASSSGPYLSPEEDLQVQLWMPSMGHGSSPVTIAEDTDGIVKVTKVFFIMPGDWELRIKLLEGASVLGQVNVPLNIR